jgi:RNA 2',3'-cyclic 3'-phosphodiesterase
LPAQVCVATVGSDERARLFVALELPATARQALFDWGAVVLSGRTELRAVALPALHVTLCFLGWRSVSEIEAIAAACEVVADRPAVELSLGDGVWLPMRRPRALAVALADPDQALAGVQSGLSAVLRAGGWYVPEQRPFLAHVTVARVARGARIRREVLPPPPPDAVTASTVTLYRSRLERGGARYEPLASVALGSLRPASDR